MADTEEIATVTWTDDGRRVDASDRRVAVPFLTREALMRQRIDGDEWIVYTDVSANGIAQAAQRAAAGRRGA